MSQSSSRNGKEVARPTTFDPAIAKAVVWEISHGKPLSSFTNDPRWPELRTIFDWSRQNEQFAQELAVARETAAHHYASEVLEIADDRSNDTIDGMPNNAAVQRDRLRVDQRRWLAGKYSPAYTEKQIHLGATDSQSVAAVEHTYAFELLNPDELAELQRLLHKARRPTTIEG
jgi:hypothetical protein